MITGTRPGDCPQAVIGFPLNDYLESLEIYLLESKDIAVKTCI